MLALPAAIAALPRIFGFSWRRGRGDFRWRPNGLCAAWARWLVERSRFADGQVSAHFLEAFLADSPDGQQVIDTFEGAVGLTHLQDFVGGCRTNSWDLLKLFGVCGIDVDRLERRFLCRARDAFQ